jgi:hypothetical protein
MRTLERKAFIVRAKQPGEIFQRATSFGVTTNHNENTFV